MSTRHVRLFVVLVLLALTGCGAFFRLKGISDESAWYDEVITLQLLDAPCLSHFLGLEIADDPPMTPIYFTLAYWWSRLFTPKDVCMRLLSVLIGLATIPATYMLSRLFYGRAASLVAAAALTFSAVHIYHSQEVRVYGLVVLLAVMSMYSMLQAEAVQNRGKRSGFWWFACAVFNLALPFTHFMSVFMFPAQFVYLLINKSGKKSLATWIVIHAAIGLALLVWLLPNATEMDRRLTWMPTPSWKQLGLFLRVFSGAGTGGWVGKPQVEWVMVISSWSLILVHLLRTALSARGLIKQDPNRNVEGKKVTLLLAWLFVPLALLALSSILLKPAFVLRYSLYCILPLYILLGGAVCMPLAPRWLSILRAAAVLVLVVAWSYQLSQSLQQPRRADFIKAGRLLKDQVQETERVFLPMNFEIALKYHFPELANHLIGPLSPMEIVQGVAKAHSDGKGAWTVLGKMDDLSAFEAKCQSRSLQYTTRSFPGVPPLRVYHFPPPNLRAHLPDDQQGPPS